MRGQKSEKCILKSKDIEKSGKANAFMFCKCVMFSACSGFNVVNPLMQLDIARWKSTTCFASLFFYIQQPQLQKIQPIDSTCWVANQRKCSFLLVLHWLQKLSVNFQNWENCEPNKFTWDYSDSSVVLVFEISVISCDKLHRPVLCGVCTLIAGLTFCCVHCREWHVTSVKAENIVDRRSGSWWLISKFISSKTCKFITLTSLPNCWLRWYGFWHDGAFGDSIDTAGDTVALKGFGLCVYVFWGLQMKMKTFLWNMACLSEQVLWRFYEFFQPLYQSWELQYCLGMTCDTEADNCYSCIQHFM